MARANLIAATVAVALAVAAGCTREPRRIPYIPPDLANWSDTYRGVKGLKLHVFTSTGTFSPPAAVLGGSWLEQIRLEVPAFLIEHPRAGLLVVGTGLAPALGTAPEKHLGWFLAALADAKVVKGQDLVSQMKAAGFDPEQVRRMILPDCRFTATGQVAHFPEAEAVVAKAERAWALQGGLASAVRREDLLAIHRWAAVDFAEGEPLGTFSRAHDLLGDGSVLLLDVPGYTPGTMAVLVRLPSGPVVLAGGAAPRSETLRTPLVPVVATDPDAWWQSAWRIKRFRELATDLVVVPGFETTTLGTRDRGDLHVHRTESGAGAEADREPAAARRLREQPSFPLQDPPTSPPPLGR